MIDINALPIVVVRPAPWPARTGWIMTVVPPR